MLCFKSFLEELPKDKQIIYVLKTNTGNISQEYTYTDTSYFSDKNTFSPALDDVPLSILELRTYYWIDKEDYHCIRTSNSNIFYEKIRNILYLYSKILKLRYTLCE